ncbi:MAG: DUF4381 family protein [Candidatus Dependentiae bacterium]|nr:DUF4381 family protein [Candidatus Dependentiae bacterium]
MVSIEPGMNEQGLYTIYGPIHVPFWQTNGFYWAVGTVVICLVLVLAWYTIAWYRAKRLVLPPWERTLRALVLLKKDNRATVAQGKEFYTELTSLLKKYMHERYGFEMYEKTDEEFLRYIASKNFSADLLADLETIFSGSITIKFANVQAMQEQIESDFVRATSFVKRSIPRN